MCVCVMGSSLGGWKGCVYIHTFKYMHISPPTFMYYLDGRRVVRKEALQLALVHLGVAHRVDQHLRDGHALRLCLEGLLCFFGGGGGCCGCVCMYGVIWQIHPYI